jgi:hypothetical protein
MSMERWTHLFLYIFLKLSSSRENPEKGSKVLNGKNHNEGGVGIFKVYR